MRVRKSNESDKREKVSRLAEKSKNLCRCGLENVGGKCTRCADFERDPIGEIVKVMATYPANHPQREKLLTQIKRYEERT